MRKRSALLLFTTHLIVGIAGFAAGIYTLPILIAPAAPSNSEVASAAAKASYSAKFKRDLKGSDAFHWGEGEISLGKESISFMGDLSPGPDYKLYLSPEFVETDTDFKLLKSKMKQIGDIKTFKNFVLELPASVNIDQYTSVIVWCESFGKFITSAKYK